MTVDLGLLILTAASIGCIHTLLGPDHYVPFVAMGAARRWTTRKTLWITSLCGVGHVLGSVAIGMVGIGIGVSLHRLEWLEGLRGDAAAWLLTAFGLAYLAWGLKHAWRSRPHAHPHFHGDGTLHEHVHGHEGLHLHPHLHPGLQVFDLRFGKGRLYGNQSRPPLSGAGASIKLFKKFA